LDYNEWNADSLRVRHEKLKEEVMALWSVRDKHDIFRQATTGDVERQISVPLRAR